MARKSDIVDGLTGQVEGMSKRQAGEVVDIIFDKVTDYLASGEGVQVAGFGTFAISERAERQGRNPRTGEAITIAASKSVRFKPAKALKDSVNG